MYTERAKFEFYESIPQSERLEFLARLARTLEEATSEPPTSNPGFSIDVKSSGKVCIDIWHPWKRDALWLEVRSGFVKRLYRITSAPSIVTEPTKNANGDSDV